ncbi:MAG: ElyC/SanA/YdcF family protein [Lautropia sp.]|nr:ElyC/SanA/YdcF family protein [Lautropia sp.]
MPMTLLLVLSGFWLWRRFWPDARFSRRLLAVLVGCWLLIGSIPAVGNLWVQALEGEPLSIEEQVESLGKVDAIIVPGSGGPPINGQKAVQHLGGYVRLLSAVEIWRRTGGMLILLGGLADGPENSLAAGMRDIAIDLGVPAGQIRIVGDSSTTRQDLQGAAMLLAREFPAASQGIGLRAAGVQRPASARTEAIGTDRVAPALAPGAAARDTALSDPVESTVAGGRDDGRISSQARVVLVTSALHMERTRATARQLGFDPLPIRCDYRQIGSPGWRAWLPNNGAPWRFRLALHETVGLWVYRLRGWAQ